LVLIDQVIDFKSTDYEANALTTRCSFICQGRLPRSGDSERTFSVLESSCHLLLPF